jgi:hypothetical protein
MPFQEPLGPYAKRLVGGKVGPNRAAVDETDGAGSHGFGGAARDVFRYGNL